MGSGSDSAESTLSFKVTDLRRSIGSAQSVICRTQMGGTRIGDVQVADSPVLVEAVLESVSGGIGVRGTVSFAWKAPCRRCLGAAAGSTDAEISELFTDHGRDGDALPIVDGWIDLEPAVRDTVLLGLPLAPLCAPDCAGPAPEEFPVAVPGNAGDGRTGEEAGLQDARWAALSELRFDHGDTDG